MPGVIEPRQSPSYLQSTLGFLQTAKAGMDLGKQLGQPDQPGAAPTGAPAPQAQGMGLTDNSAAANPGMGAIGRRLNGSQGPMRGGY